MAGRAQAMLRSWVRTSLRSASRIASKPWLARREAPSGRPVRACSARSPSRARDWPEGISRVRTNRDVLRMGPSQRFSMKGKACRGAADQQREEPDPLRRGQGERARLLPLPRLLDQGEQLGIGVDRGHPGIGLRLPAQPLQVPEEPGLVDPSVPAGVEFHPEEVEAAVVAVEDLPGLAGGALHGKALGEEDADLEPGDARGHAERPQGGGPQDHGPPSRQQGDRIGVLAGPGRSLPPPAPEVEEAGAGPEGGQEDGGDAVGSQPRDLAHRGDLGHAQGEQAGQGGEGSRRGRIGRSGPGPRGPPPGTGAGRPPCGRRCRDGATGPGARRTTGGGAGGRCAGRGRGRSTAGSRPRRPGWRPGAAGGRGSAPGSAGRRPGRPGRRGRRRAGSAWRRGRSSRGCPPGPATGWPCGSAGPPPRRGPGPPPGAGGGGARASAPWPASARCGARRARPSRCAGRGSPGRSAAAARGPVPGPGGPSPGGGPGAPAGRRGSGS